MNDQMHHDRQRPPARPGDGRPDPQSTGDRGPGRHGVHDVVRDTPVVEQRGLWFEEFTEGVTYLHRPGRTLTEADNTFFTAVTMNTQPLHLDAAWAAEQPGFRGERLVNSMLTLSTVVGLSVSQLSLGTIVANLGFRDIEFPAPVFHGDTLYAETTCVGTRLSRSRPGQGIVELRHVGRNQDGVVVCTAVRSTLMRCRPDDGDRS